MRLAALSPEPSGAPVRLTASGVGPMHSVFFWLQAVWARRPNTGRRVFSCLSWKGLATLSDPGPVVRLKVWNRSRSLRSTSPCRLVHLGLGRTADSRGKRVRGRLGASEGPPRSHRSTLPRTDPGSPVPSHHLRPDRLAERASRRSAGSRHRALLLQVLYSIRSGCWWNNWNTTVPRRPI
jgi:hypothetical protein